MKNLANLNTLRFLLAFLVILSHADGYLLQVGIEWDTPISDKGSLAVMYFFALSGFLIIRLIHIEVSEGKFDLKKFYIRRALRILPLYFVIFITGLLIYHVIIPVLGLNLKFDYDVASMVRHFGFLVPNVFVAKFMEEMGGILFVLWSIGVEIQFYLFVPFVFLIFGKRAIIALAALFLTHVAIDYNSDILSGNFIVYYPFLFAGVITILSHEGKLNWLMRPYPVRIILLITFICSLVFEWDLGSPVNNNVATTILSSLFICSIADYPLFIIKNRSLNYLGDISYGLYMYHMIPCSILIYAIQRTGMAQKMGSWFTGSVYLVLSVVITIIISHLSYKHFEKPLIDIKKKFRTLTGRKKEYA